MDRKLFIRSMAAVGAVMPGFKEQPVKEMGPMTIPPYLKAGDLIGICCPAGFMKNEEIQPALKQLKDWGFNVRLGATIGKKDFGFGGTDAERAADFQSQLDDPAIRAVLCARGGYGSIRIIDEIDFSKFAQNPKWILGFSDITVIHAHLSRNYGIATIHSKMCNSFPDDIMHAEPDQAVSIESIWQVLSGKRMAYRWKPNPANKAGISQGLLVGGNLKTIESLSGTKSDLLTEDRILFVEDTGEYLYSIDRMFWNLKRTDKLASLRGLIVGGFKIKPDDPGEEFGKTIYEIVSEKVKEYNYPVCFDFPVGHQKYNMALKCGVLHRLDVKADEVLLEESK
jgi:muramoyltetrapeptide carboxypeptidase